jgi:hypothetical protein
MTTRRNAFLTTAVTTAALTLLNFVSYFEARQALYAAYSAATVTMDPGSDAAMAEQGSASQLLASGLRQLLYGHINYEVAIVVALAIRARDDRPCKAYGST